MPKGLQIYMFKKLFLKCNAWRARETASSRTPFDVSAEMDNVDWDAVLEDDATFNENLGNLKQNYPEYDWHDWEAEELERAREQEMIWHEMANSEPEREPDDSIPEDDAEPEDTGGWHIEQTDEYDIHSIEVEIGPHRTRSKGRRYLYGRIQLSVSEDWVGLPAKISVSVPRTQSS